MLSWHKEIVCRNIAYLSTPGQTPHLPHLPPLAPAEIDQKTAGIIFTLAKLAISSSSACGVVLPKWRRRNERTIFPGLWPPLQMDNLSLALQMALTNVLPGSFFFRWCWKEQIWQQLLRFWMYDVDNWRYAPGIQFGTWDAGRLRLEMWKYDNSRQVWKMGSHLSMELGCMV